MSRNLLKKGALASSVLVIVLCWTVFEAPAHTLAATPTDPSLQQIFDSQICHDLMGIKGQKLGKYCKGYTYQKDLDKAQKKICGKYGDNKLKSQCQAYATAKASSPTPSCSGPSCDLIASYVNPVIDLLSIAFGLIAVISIIMGGIQYSASQGDPQKAAAAKSRISNTIIAIFAYLFLYAFLQFLIPGGAFH
jgi:hypothetical protein